MAGSPGEIIVLDALRRSWWILLLLTAAGAAAAAAWTLSRPNQYSSRAEILVSVAVPNGSATGVSPEAADRTVQTGISVLRSPRVERIVASKYGDVEPVSAEQLANTNVIALTSKASVSSRAADLANAFANAYIFVRSQQSAAQARAIRKQVLVSAAELQSSIDSRTSEAARERRRNPNSSTIPLLIAERADLLRRKGVLLQQLDAANVSATSDADVVLSSARPSAAPVNPSPVRNGALGGLLGFLIALVIALLRPLKVDPRYVYSANQ